MFNRIYVVMHWSCFCYQFERSTLYITDARPEDRGIYRCEVENSAGQSYADVMVEVESEFSQSFYTYFQLLCLCKFLT